MGRLVGFWLAVVILERSILGIFVQVYADEVGCLVDPKEIGVAHTMAIYTCRG
jgi:hypothetical protein